MEIKNPHIHAAAIVLGRLRSGIVLLGTKNGINDTFTTPDKFVQNSNIQIALYRNGQRLDEGVGNDYVASESGGPGTGYDTVQVYGPALEAWEKLTSDYVVDTTV